MLIDRKSFLSILKSLRGFAGDDKTPLFALKYVHMETDGDKLILRVSNGTLFAKATIRLDEELEINFYLPIGKLVEALENLVAEFVNLSFQNNKVVVKGGKNQISISGTDNCVDFPIIAGMPEESVLLDSEMFWDKIDTVALCADPKHAQLILRCVAIKSDGDVITMGATNLVTSAMNLIRVQVPEFKTAVGLDFLKAAKGISKGEKELSLAFDNGKLYLGIGRFEVGTITVVSQIPNLARVFDIDKDAFKFSFQTNEAKDAANIASMFAKENETKPDFVKFSSVEDGEIRVYAESQSGHSEAAFAYTGEFKGIHGFNVNYFLGMCGLFENINCELTEATKSKLIFRSDEDKDWLMLISPMT